MNDFRNRSTSFLHMVLTKNNLLLLVKNLAPLLPLTSLSLGSFLKEDYKAKEQIIGV